MLKIAICDDDKVFCSWIVKVLARSGSDILQECDVEIYTTGTKLCRDLQNGIGYDLVLLDIDLNESRCDGVSVGRFIRGELNDQSIQIVYVSGKTQYALDLFQNRPFDFLVKPLREEDIIGCINKVIQVGVDINHVYHFTYNKKHFLIKSKNIIYASSNLRKVTLFTTDGNYEFYGILVEVLEKLPSADFVMIHKSFIINLNYLKSLGEGEVHLTNGTVLAVSRAFKKQLQEKCMERVIGKRDDHFRKRK